MLFSGHYAYKSSKAWQCTSSVRVFLSHSTTNDMFNHGPSPGVGAGVGGSQGNVGAGVGSGVGGRMSGYTVAVGRISLCARTCVCFCCYVCTPDRRRLGMSGVGDGRQ